MIIFMYLFRDEQSGLQKIELGAGRTTSDTSVLAWIPIITNQTATVTYRATNNGKCKYDVAVTLCITLFEKGRILSL